jgi:hypothetical protein
LLRSGKKSTRSARPELAASLTPSHAPALAACWGDGAALTSGDTAADATAEDDRGVAGPGGAVSGRVSTSGATATAKDSVSRLGDGAGEAWWEGPLHAGEQEGGGRGRAEMGGGGRVGGRATCTSEQTGGATGQRMQA